VQAVVFDETAVEAGLVTRGDGDATALAREGPDPRRVATEDVRGCVASSACGRKHRTREVQRGGTVDRGSARIAVHLSRGRSELRLPNAASPPPSDDEVSRVMIVATLKLEARRQARLHLVGSSGKRMAGFPDPAAARLRPRMSQRTLVARRSSRRCKAWRAAGCNQESGSPQGARDGSRLQKSVRRIFLASSRGASVLETAGRPAGSVG